MLFSTLLKRLEIRYQWVRTDVAAVVFQPMIFSVIGKRSTNSAKGALLYELCWCVYELYSVFHMVLRSKSLYLSSEYFRSSCFRQTTFFRFSEVLIVEPQFALKFSTVQSIYISHYIQSVLYSDSNCIAAPMVFSPSQQSVISCESVTFMQLCDSSAALWLVRHIFWCKPHRKMFFGCSETRKWLNFIGSKVFAYIRIT